MLNRFEKHGALLSELAIKKLKKEKMLPKTHITDVL